MYIVAPIAESLDLGGGSGLSGGLDPPSAECPQPVHTNARDILRDDLGWATGGGGGSAWDNNRGLHWHEGHPDVKAWYDDIRGRMRGLYDRPKLLRCSDEARRKALSWLGSLRSVLRQIKSNPTHYSGFTSVPAGGMKVSSLNMKTYYFREGNPNKPKDAAVPVKTSGTEVPFDPDVGGAGGDPTKSGANRVTQLEKDAIAAGIVAPIVVAPATPSTVTIAGTPGQAVDGSLYTAQSVGGVPAPAPGAGPAGLPPQILGVSTETVLLGAAAVLAFTFLKK